MRIDKIITNSKSSWLSTEFSLDNDDVNEDGEF